MFNIDKQSRVPIFKQIEDSVKKCIVLKVLEGGERLPSVREVSTMFSINPNTIQKAYSELEREMVTYSVPGVGRFVSLNALEILQKDMIREKENLKNVVGNLRLLGMSKDEILTCVTKIFDKEEKQ